MLKHRRYKELMEPLIAYSCDRLGGVNNQQLGLLKLIYEIIREGIADLNQDKSETLKKDAQQYFDSDLFVYHCKCVAIDEKLMLYVVKNPLKYLHIFNRYNMETTYNESSV